MNLRRHFLRIAATVIWLAVLVAFWVYMTANDYTIRTATLVLVDAVKTSPASPLVFAAVLVVRPLTLFPIFLLAIAAGYLYGPLIGTLVVFTGGSVSAFLGYLAGFIGVTMRGFMVGTLIGGTLVNCSLVLFGAGIQGELDGDNFGLNAKTLLVSLVVVSVCVLFSWLIRRGMRVSHGPAGSPMEHSEKTGPV